MPIGFTRLQAFGQRRSPLKQAEGDSPPSLQLTHADAISFSGKTAPQEPSPGLRLDPRRLLSRLWQAILAPIRWPLSRLGLLPARDEHPTPVSTLAAFREKLASKNPFVTHPAIHSQNIEPSGSPTGTQPVAPPETVALTKKLPEEDRASHAPEPGQGPRFGSTNNPFATATAGVGLRTKMPLPSQDVQKAMKARLEARLLWDAVQSGEVKALRKLIAHGVNVNIRQPDGRTPLHLAVASGNLPLVLTLLEAPKIAVSAADERGTHPLHLAIRGNHAAMVDVLSRHGAKLEADSWYENRPLQLATELGHETVARLLLQHGAQVDGQSWQGYTPLYWAARRGHLGQVNTLLAHHADVTRPNRYGETPLHGAASGGDAAVMQAMLKTLPEGVARKHAVNAPDQNGETPLHLAARHDHIAVLGVLTDQGGDLHQVSGSGETPQAILDKRRHLRARR